MRLTFLAALASSTLSLADFTPTQISRTVELGGALTRSTTIYTLKHDGSASTDWTISVPSAGRREGADGSETEAGFVEAHVGKQGSRKLVSMERVKSGISSSHYVLHLPSPTTDDPTIVTLLAISSHATHPKPATLAQTADTVLMLWEADLLAGLSAKDMASVQEMKIKVKAPSPRIGEIKAPTGFELSYTKGGATATLTSRGPLSQFPAGPQIASLHYAQVEPVTAIRKLDRIVEVSHWGANLAIQDNVDLFNAGPTLLGQFSRLAHQRATMQRRASPLSITSLSYALPPNVHSPYFYDIVGNVSTSRFRPSAPSSAGVKLPSQRKGAAYSVLEIIPRYPLMGGWNYTYTVGYDAPLDDYLKQKGSGDYSLRVPFLTPIKDLAVDDVTVEIRLPEGARNIRVSLPFPVDSISPVEGQQPELRKTYLDSTGRPTVILTKKDCSDRHGAEVLITYTLNPLQDLLRKPLIVASVLSLVFLAIIGAKQLDWNIPGELEKSKKE